jgi:ABC-2 type transport system ATP-binding protein
VTDAQAVSSAIRAEDLRIVRRGRTVIDRIALDITGGIVGVVGPSGSGKTTLLRAIAGVQRVDSGTLTVLGTPAGSRALRARIGYMPQSPALYEDISVRENLRYFADVVGRRDRIPAVAKIVGLESRLDARVRDTSGGERTRVSLGIAFLGEPDVLLLDEPTVGLDPLLRRSLWRTFRDAADSGATVLVSTHVMDEAARCDSLLLLRDGALLAVASPSELRNATGEASVEDAFVALAGGS